MVSHPIHASVSVPAMFAVLHVLITNTNVRLYGYICIVWCVAMSVVGNKSDLENNRMVSRDRGVDLAHSLGGMFTETSAANNTGQLC